MFAFKTSEDIKFMQETQSKIFNNQVGTSELVVAMEELAELQQQISKCVRGCGNKDNLTEEIADVLICLDRLTYYADISDIDINNAVIQKINKHKARVAEWKKERIM